MGPALGGFPLNNNSRLILAEDGSTEASFIFSTSHEHVGQLENAEESRKDRAILQAYPI